MHDRIALPDFAFPDDMEDRLLAYLAATGDTLYDLTCWIGVGRELADCDPELLQIYAFLKRYAASGWRGVLVELAWFLDQVGRSEQSQAVFQELEQDDDRAAKEKEAGAQFYYDNALFQQGLLFFERDEPEQALDCFLRADRYALPDKEALWSNLGATCHELDRYDEAVVWYEKALAEVVPELLVPSDGSFEDDEWRLRLRDQEDLLKRSIELAANREPPIGVPGELGIE